MTNDQIKLIHVAARKCGLNDDQYRTLLKSAGGVESSKDLTNEKFEDVMAVLEDMGFGNQGGPNAQCPNYYWRNKANRGGRANERMVHLIHRLAPQQRYGLDALCRKFSANRASEPEGLYPREAWKLIEMLKKVIDRDGEDAGGPDAPEAKDRPQGSGRGHEARLF